jgi:hypothetical protein
LESPLPGDWIIRNEAPLEVKLRALEGLVAHELGRQIRVEKRWVERDALVVTGRFQFQPLAAARENALVHLYTKDTDLEERGIGSQMADSLSQFLQRLGDLANLPVIDRTEPRALTRIPYRCHSSSFAIRRSQDEQERTRQLRVLLDHLTTQTELQFDICKRPFETWRVTEQTSP